MLDVSWRWDDWTSDVLKLESETVRIAKNQTLFKDIRILGCGAQEEQTALHLNEVACNKKSGENDGP